MLLTSYPPQLLGDDAAVNHLIANRVVTCDFFVAGTGFEPVTSGL
jgi:thiamine monophosphate kinase